MVKADYVDGADWVYDHDMNALGAAVNVVVSGSVNGTPTALTLWTGTQTQYDAIDPKDSSTVYVVTA